MELIIYNPTGEQAMQPIEWNYDELKAWLVGGLAKYEGRIYDDTQISEAKKDAATLRKLASAIDTRRKDIKRRCMEPYTGFERQAKELTGMIDRCVCDISRQVTAYNDARKAEKLDVIRQLYAKHADDLAELVPLDRLLNQRWLNVGYSLTNIEGELASKLNDIRDALAAIDGMEYETDVRMAVKNSYLNTFDLPAAMAAGTRLKTEKAKLAEYEARRKAEADKPEAAAQEPRQAEPEPAAEPAQEQIYTLRFQVTGTAAQLMGLSTYLKAHGIQYTKI